MTDPGPGPGVSSPVISELLLRTPLTQSRPPLTQSRPPLTQSRPPLTQTPPHPEQTPLTQSRPPPPQTPLTRADPPSPRADPDPPHQSRPPLTQSRPPSPREPHLTQSRPPPHPEQTPPHPEPHLHFLCLTLCPNKHTRPNVWRDGAQNTQRSLSKSRGWHTPPPHRPLTPGLPWAVLRSEPAPYVEETGGGGALETRRRRRRRSCTQTQVQRPRPGYPHPPLIRPGHPGERRC
ncbi:uncharacterized protein LOC129411049 [Boleophthalmus pectinirostris]|uniref:uncharacterized protein LOC129411049 n=1 Tax=Boleophthalmus pectinirostris TaxID=150288 RepID=UPI00242CDE60|nr:uncharacterized protein LOC129411049 [Boleophthalmus pectinirostris]